ncbi:hypothetical protein [Actinoplanes sp. NPDC051494]|uniref:hypothetical protein n=1 Tax=Actinoplanes sp. NPDC051494 TaxID=3363907 RepID=UPI003795EEFB
MTTDVLHEWSVRRAMAAAAVVSFSAAVVVQVVLGAVLRTGIGPAVVFVVVYTLVFTGGSVLLDRARPTRLRATAEGLELAGARRDGVFLPWPVVTAVRVRWFWPVATLEVTVPEAQTGRVVPLARGGRGPLRRRRAGHVRFVVPLAGLPAPAATIGADLKG